MTLSARHENHGPSELVKLQRENERLRTALRQTVVAVELIRSQIAGEAGVDMTPEQIAAIINKTMDQASAALDPRKR